MLEINDLTVHYGEVEALHRVSLWVAKGEVVTIIGANGAGKSTLLRSISGLVKVNSGTVTFDGKEITSWRPDRIVVQGLIHCPEGRGILQRMTVQENLEMGAFRRGARVDLKEDFANIFSLFPRMRERQNQLAASLSGGEQQMLAIGRGLMARPNLLMIDEPSLGLAPFLVSELFRVISQLKERGLTILLVEQNAMQALHCSDRAYVLETGRIVLGGAAESLVQDPRIRDAYLGTGKRRQP